MAYIDTLNDFLRRTFSPHGYNEIIREGRRHALRYMNVRKRMMQRKLNRLYKGNNQWMT